MVTTKELCDRLGISYTGLYYWLRVVDVPKRYNEKRERVFTQEDVEKIIKKRENKD